WMSRSLARAGLQLGQVMTGALANRLDAMEERLNTGPIAKSSGAAQNRMRELLTHDRAMVAVQEHVVRGDRGAQKELVAPPKRGSSSSAAQGRMRDLLRQDRQMLAGQHEDDDEFLREAHAPEVAPKSSRELPKGVISQLSSLQPSAAAAPEPE